MNDSEGGRSVSFAPLHLLLRSVRRVAILVARKVLARPALRRVNEALLKMALHGLGILNYRSSRESGEDYAIRLLAAAAQGSTWLAFDVGANVGDYTRALLDASATLDVVAIEPHPDAARRLREIDDPRLTVIEAAAGAQPQAAVQLFDYAEGAGGSSHASLHADVFSQIHRKQTRTVTVAMTTIDEVLAQLDADEIDFLKIDTEGHELAVLQGAEKALRLGRIGAVQFEFNEMNVISRVFLRDLAAALEGFALHRLLPNGLIRLHVQPLDEIFAFQNILAIRPGSRFGHLIRP